MSINGEIKNVLYAFWFFVFNFTKTTEFLPSEIKKTLIKNENIF